MNNKQLSRLAFAALLLCGAVQAQTAQTTPAAPTTSSVAIFGVLDLGLVAIDGMEAKTRRFVSSGSQMGSRLGFRGTEEISPGWKAMFTIEHQFYGDTGAQSQTNPSGPIPARALVGIPNTVRNVLEPQLREFLNREVQNQFWHRQAWVGLVTPGGAVLAGRQYSPVFATFARFDPHLAGNIGNAFAAITTPTGLEPRVDNSLQYVAELGGFRLNVMVGAGEGSIPDARFWGFSAGYAVGGLDIGVGHQRRKRGLDYLDSLENTVVGASSSFGAWKLTGSWTSVKDAHPSLGAELRAGLLASTNPALVAFRPQFLQYAGQIASNLGYDGKLMYGGVHYQINERNKLVVSYGDYNDKVDQRDVAIGGVALEHQLSKRTSIWLSGSKVDNKSFNQILPYSQGLLYGFTDKPGRDASAYSLNIVHRF